MNKRMPLLIKLLSLASLVALAACSELGLIPGTSDLLSGTPYPAATGGSTAVATVSVLTAVPVTSQPLGGQVTATPGVVSTAPAGQDLSVTLADDGKTVNLKVGQRFLLNLGADYNWTPTIADQTIVSRVIGILVIHGAQGIYEAHAPGTTTLTATGDPACRQSTPACAMPSRLFKVTIIVEP